MSPQVRAAPYGSVAMRQNRLSHMNCRTALICFSPAQYGEAQYGEAQLGWFEAKCGKTLIHTAICSTVQMRNAFSDIRGSRP